jgi:hypothetical protein
VTTDCGRPPRCDATTSLLLRDAPTRPNISRDLGRPITDRLHNYPRGRVWHEQPHQPPFFADYEFANAVRDIDELRSTLQSEQRAIAWPASHPSAATLQRACLSRSWHVSRDQSEIRRS